MPFAPWMDQPPASRSTCEPLRGNRGPHHEGNRPVRLQRTERKSSMKSRILIAAALLATAGLAAQAAEMTLYENPGFGGRQLTLRGVMPDINSFGFNDRASSLLV